MKYKGLLFAAMALVLLTLATIPAAAQQARQGGTVVDEAGNPVAGIELTLERVDKSGSGRSSLKETTDANGNFTFVNMGPGQWKLSIKAEGFAPYMEVVTISAINRNEDMTITLQAGTPLASENAQEEAKAVIAEADELLAAGNFDEAIAKYNELATKYPSIKGSIDLYVGQAYEDKGDQEKAKEFYASALEADPNSAVALKKLGDMAVAAYEYEPAMEYYDRLLAVKTDDAALFYTGGEIALSVGNNEKAVQYFSHYVETGTDQSLLVNAHMNLGFTLSVMGQNEEAIKNLEKVLELAPDFPYAADIQAEIDRLKAAQD